MTGTNNREMTPLTMNPVKAHVKQRTKPMTGIL